MEILYTQKAEKQLKKIVKSDRASAVRIMKTIELYADNQKRNFDIKILTGEL